ncbi:MAG: pyrD [Dehalococcoidia bacterium]|nr:pyrD [Dehalococcoidia bacterium]
MTKESAVRIVNTSVQLAPGNRRGLLLKNPVVTAAGTCGYGIEIADYVDVERLGAIVCKGTTLHPRDGNPQPRLAETASGLLNSIGLQNIGVEALARDKAPVWAGWQVPVIVNIAGESLTEYARIARRLDDVPGISGIEVNISCPNVSGGGMEFGTEPRLAACVTASVRKATSLPLLVKLSPNVKDIAAIARAVVDAGADALTLTNTFKGMAIDLKGRRPVLGNVAGGLSGPAIKPMALYMVYRVAAAVTVPIIGCGGIANAGDALEFIVAGARAVQIGTAALSNPGVFMEVVEGIERFLKGEKIADINALVGVARGS